MVYNFFYRALHYKCNTCLSENLLEVAGSKGTQGPASRGRQSHPRFGALFPDLLLYLLMCKHMAYQMEVFKKLTPDFKGRAHIIQSPEILKCLKETRSPRILLAKIIIVN